MVDKNYCKKYGKTIFCKILVLEKYIWVKFGNQPFHTTFLAMMCPVVLLGLFIEEIEQILAFCHKNTIKVQCGPTSLIFCSFVHFHHSPAIFCHFGLGLRRRGFWNPTPVENIGKKYGTIWVFYQKFCLP